MVRFLKNYSLSSVLFLLFMVSWLAQFIFQLYEFRDDAAEHGQAFEWLQFWPDFATATFENWQSEFLQLFTMVVLTAMLVHKGSPESKDSDEQMQAALRRIERRLREMQPAKAKR